MKNNIEKSLNRAISQLPRPAVQELWEQPVSKMTEHDYITRQEVPRSLWSGSSARTLLATAACCLVMFVGGGTLHYQNQVVRTVVDIDINPSLELNLNRKDKVVSTTGLNHEAEELLNTIDVKGMDAKAAIELIMLEAKEQHYFSQNENAVLLSVSANNEKSAVLLEEELSQQVRIAVDRKETPVTVVSQQFDNNDKALRDDSDKYKVSQGKMALIKKLEALDLFYTREKFVSLSIEELLQLLQEEETDLSDRVKVNSSTWISEKTAVPVVDETKPDVKETEAIKVQETSESVALEVQPEIKPTSAKTKPAPVETKPAPPESLKPETEAPVQQIPHAPIPEADDDLDDNDDHKDTDDESVSDGDDTDINDSDDDDSADSGDDSDDSDDSDEEDD